MDAEAIVAVSAAVVGLVQLVKWGGLPDRLGPLAVLAIAALGVVLWGYSEGTYERAKLFNYFAGWVAVSIGAAGIFGFTRAGGDAVSRMTPPPSSGAGSSPTIKEKP
jgi:hypothetical protein